MCDRYTTDHISGSSFYRFRCNSRQGESQSCGRVANPPKFNKSTRQFLGLALYYRRFIQKFADVAAPLHNLTQKDVVFSWSNDCSRALKIFKCKLIGVPILVYPSSSGQGSKPNSASNDASALGLGAILERGGGGGGGGHVIAYASRILTKAVANYSVIQRECLAV